MISTPLVENFLFIFSKKKKKEEEEEEVMHSSGRTKYTHHLGEKVYEHSVMYSSDERNFHMLRYGEIIRP